MSDCTSPEEGSGLEPTTGPGPDDPERAVRGLVAGRVQGVGFRWYVTRVAATLGLSGDVRNLPDGRVEIRARGPKLEIDKLLDAVRRGPPSSQVSSVEVFELESDTHFVGFDIRH
jgi:acylphosphatase